MRYLPSDKYNVAWFKLAECVSRGEKERALGVYRLLSHSFDDRAYAAQLEGDILLSCDDQAGAAEKFKEAIELYRKDGRTLEAAAVSEHLIILIEDKKECLAMLIEFYAILGIQSKIISHTQSLVALCIKTHDLERVIVVMDQLDSLRSLAEMALVRKPLVIALCQQRSMPKIVIVAQLEKLIDGLLLSDDNLLQRFLIEMAGVSEEYQNHAAAYVVSR